MYDLYTWSTPNGRKISIMLEELGVPYTVHPVDLGQGEQLTPEFRRISPNGKIPALVDRDANRSLMESGAILLYLAERHDGFWGDDRWQTIEWLMLQMGGIGPMLGQAHHFLHFNPGKSPYAETRYRTEARRLYGVLDDRLTRLEYLSGSYSIADVATWPWIARYSWHGIDWEEFPHVERWYLRIADRPAVQRGYHVPAQVEDIPRP